MNTRHTAPAHRGKELASNAFESMRGLMERMESFFEKPFDLIGSLAEPKVDIEETPMELVVTARLPGFQRGDVAVNVTENSVTLRGCRTTSKESRRHGALEREEMEKTFVRSLTLPAPVVLSGAKASFKGDRLEIHLPRMHETEVRSLEVE
ncbi:MAG: Hsp20/alpha crystallin family protein [Elusimicrobia bacterium]|nr:Hsp20/alpha crystallin family protein [Elusimicrobiota bacterium]